MEYSSPHKNLIIFKKTTFTFIVNLCNFDAVFLYSGFGRFGQLTPKNLFLSSSFRSIWSPWGPGLHCVLLFLRTGTKDSLAANAIWSSKPSQTWRSTQNLCTSPISTSVLSAPNISQPLPHWTNTLKTTPEKPQLCAAWSALKYSWTKKNLESTRRGSTPDWNMCRATTACALSGENPEHKCWHLSNYF